MNGKYHYRICLSHFPKPNENGEIEVKSEIDSETRIVPSCDVYTICQEYTHMLKREWYFKYKHEGFKEKGMVEPYFV